MDSRPSANDEASIVVQMFFLSAGYAPGERIAGLVSVGRNACGSAECGGVSNYAIKQPSAT
jgi:hypothetical protein